MKRFTPSEDDYIRQNYLQLSLNQMGNHLGRVLNSVHGRMKVLGLVVPKEILRQRHKASFAHLAESGKVGRFKKGHVPVNKGQKMPPEVYAKAAATMFKKGHTPHNTVHNGQPYLYTRKRNGRVEKLWFIQEGVCKRSAYLAYLCRRHGIDLTGRKPRLKPGFNHQQPPTINDIIIVTNAENLAANSYANYPPDVVKLIQAKGVLTRQINKIKQHE
jgi:hypothetical protein